MGQRVVIGLALWVACTPPATDPDPAPSFSWSDTGVLATYEAVPTFDGPVPQNLLMISIDTLRRDQVGRYGGGPTPFLDRLLAEGLALDDFVQCSNWTFASLTCTLSGRYPVDGGFLPQTQPVGLERVPDSLHLLADHLDGHVRVLVSGNEWFSMLTGLARGYDAFSLTEGSATTLLDEGRDLLDRTLDGRQVPWFLHVHVMEPHIPYDPPSDYLDALEGLDPLPFDLTEQDGTYDATDRWPNLSAEQQALLETHLRLRYEGEVRWLDDQLAATFARWDAEGLLDDTLVVIWTDHGEQFWERGEQSHAWNLGAEENDGVALFWAKQLHPAAVTTPTHAVDLVPTLLHLYDRPLPAGLSGLPLGAAGPQRVRFASTAGRAGGVQHVIVDGHKLLYSWKTGGLALYDRNTDGTEATDRAAQDPDRVHDLWQRLEPQAEATEQLLQGRVPRKSPSPLP